MCCKRAFLNSVTLGLMSCTARTKTFVFRFVHVGSLYVLLPYVSKDKAAPSVMYICGVLIDDLTNSYSLSMKGIVISSQRIRKECGRKLLWPSVRYEPRICVEGVRKFTKDVRIVFVLAEIRTRHVANTNQKLYLEPCCSVMSERD
jgi:hypothetical protein